MPSLFRTRWGRSWVLRQWVAAATLASNAACVYSLVSIHGSWHDPASRPASTSSRPPARCSTGRASVPSASTPSPRRPASPSGRCIIISEQGRPCRRVSRVTRPAEPDALHEKWFAEADGGLADQGRGIFRNLARSARHPKWKGCGFLRTSAELANMPGHPAMKIGAAHKKRFEDWLERHSRRKGSRERVALARQILLLLDGSFAVMLLHRDPTYMETAGEAAHALIEAALPVRIEAARAGDQRSDVPPSIAATTRVGRFALPTMTRYKGGVRTRRARAAIERRAEVGHHRRASCARSPLSASPCRAP